MTTRHAKTGKEILSNNDFWWQSDFGLFQRETNLAYQTVNNGATILTQRCQVTTEFYHYGFLIPQNRELLIFSYSIRLGEGGYEIDTLRAPAGFTGGNPALKHALQSSSLAVVNTDVFCGTTLNAGDVTVVERDFVDAGTALGAQRTSDSQTTDGTLRIWREPDNIVIRIKRLQATNYTTRIRINAWERDI
jgi:hypothetical protein